MARQTTACVTCGSAMVRPILPTDAPRCFACIKEEIRKAAAHFELTGCQEWPMCEQLLVQIVH
jgi:hypothetical protein